MGVENMKAQQLSRGEWLRLLAAGITAGGISGIVLGVTMKLLEHWSGKAVYVLLLNVDFIKWLPAQMPEWVEFTLHLAVALPIGILYLILLSLWRSPMGLSMGLSAAITCCTWIPLTQLSERTPSVTDIEALLWWIAGHLVYGFVLARFGKWWLKRGAAV
ncbi:hypothetical protein [Paenibacillus sp. sgz302251]|uniref:hypothetical protein n=1 Tax=Paenibacillus sp. sgz302251 TaxID=3414493 RepID=UPI003C7E1453